MVRVISDAVLGQGRIIDVPKSHSLYYRIGIVTRGCGDRTAEEEIWGCVPEASGLQPVCSDIVAQDLGSR